MKTYIIGVQSRMEMITKLQEKLSIPSENIILDKVQSGPLSSVITALKNGKDEDYVLLIQDDAWPCDNFYDICDKIFNTHPDAIVGLFPFDLDRKNLDNINKTSPYYYVEVLSAVGIIFPTKYIDQFLVFCETDGIPKKDDTTIFNFCKKYNIPVYQTLPAVVQHLGDKSILWPNAPKRVAMYFENHDKYDWSSTDINIPKHTLSPAEKESLQKSLNAFDKYMKKIKEV